MRGVWRMMTVCCGLAGALAASSCLPGDEDLAQVRVVLQAQSGQAMGVIDIIVEAGLYDFEAMGVAADPSFEMELTVFDPGSSAPPAFQGPILIDSAQVFTVAGDVCIGEHRFVDILASTNSTVNIPVTCSPDRPLGGANVGFVFGNAPDILDFSVTPGSPVTVGTELEIFANVTDRTGPSNTEVRFQTVDETGAVIHETTLDPPNGTIIIYSGRLTPTDLSEGLRLVAFDPDCGCDTTFHKPLFRVQDGPL